MGSGGGGSSGAISWPTYFENYHASLLDAGTGDTLNASMTDAMNAALAVNPFTTAIAFNPTTYLTQMWLNIDTLATTMSALNPITKWHDNLVSAKTAYDDHVFSTTALAAAETAFNNVLDAEYADSDLPRFQRGMQDLNAVMSSAFVTGKALIDAKIVLKKAQFSAELRLQDYRDKTSALVQSAGPIGDFYLKMTDVLQKVLSTQLETRRYGIVAQKEYYDQQLKIDEAHASWDMDVFMKGANVLAAGQGGVTHPTQRSATMLQSALGGAMSGAAMGAMLGASNIIPGIGPIAGLIGGAILGGGGGAASNK